MGLADRRDEGECRQYSTPLSEKPSAGLAGFSAGRMQWDFHHGLHKVRGEFTPHADSITVKTMNILGDSETRTSTGHVTLTVAGREVRAWAASPDYARRSKSSALRDSTRPAYWAFAQG